MCAAPAPPLHRRPAWSSPATIPARCARSPSCWRPSASTSVSAAELGLPEPEETGTTFLANAELKARPRRAAARRCRRWPTIPAWRSPALDGAPGHLFGALGRARPRISRAAMARVERELGRARHGRPARPFRLRALALAWPDGHCETLRGPGRRARWSGRRAATAASATIRSSCPTATTMTFGEMDPATKHAHQPPRRRLPPSWSRPASRSSDATAARGRTRRRLRPLRPLAVLPVEMPLLRLQQPCARADRRRRAGARRCCAELDHYAAADAGPDASPSIFFGGGTPSLMEPATVGGRDRRASAERWAVGRRYRDHARGQPDLGRGRQRFAGFRAAGVNRVSLGVQALDDGVAATSSAASTAADEALRRHRAGARGISTASPSI